MLTLATAVGAGAGVATAAGTTASSATGTATHKVIVLLKDQPASAPLNSPAFATRQSKIAASQAPLAKHLRKNSKNVRQYKLVNALSATVSTSEENALKADSSVAAVIPDSVIHGAAPTPATAADAPPAPRTAPANACGTKTKPISNEYLDTTHTQSADPATKTARSLGLTGAGVKVGWIADGIDINNPEFIRPNGSHVFSDYQDFSGDGTAAPTDGAEAFLDASAIAAQGNNSYNIQNFSAVPLAAPCYIKVEGMAPGASLVGLKVFPENNDAFNSAFLAAVDYAVTVAHVNVLNESFGNNFYPDSNTTDAQKMFNDAAVAAGVTVTVSSGDGGPANSIGTPSTDPKVISVGGSTTYRFTAQTGYGGYYPLAKGGWLSDNISPLSSSGFTQSGRTIDLIAPGDLDWAACSTDQAVYGGCAAFTGAPSPVEESGGTSESSPLTAGAAALVIQAYRQTHGGSNPTPAVVKQLLTSTADDLGHPGQEQGAGIVDTYQAALAAMSLHDANGTPARTGNTILSSQTQLDGQGLAGSAQSWNLALTNNGATTQKLSLGQRTLGDPFDVQTRTVKLSDTASKHFEDYAGQTTNYQVVHFNVPQGVDRLDEDYAYPGDPFGSLNGRVRLALIDPKGTFASHSIPQGIGNAGHADVRNPVAGTWTAMIWSRQSTVDGFVGKVIAQFAMHNYHGTGSITPSSVTLAPGQSATVKVRATTSSTPGDTANSVTVASSAGQQTSVPVILRSLVNVGQGGRFSGTLTGGNGRATFYGQTSYLQFDVPPSQRDITANFRFANKVTDPVTAVLVDPAGNAQAYDMNLTPSIGSDGSVNATSGSGVSVYSRAPAAGRWTLILEFAPAIEGTRISAPFGGSVQLNTVNVTSSGVPNSNAVTLKAGKPVTVPVTIRNTGVAPAEYFIDARTNKLATYALPITMPQPVTFPIAIGDPFPGINVPTETTSISASMTSNQRASFDLGWALGDPDVAATTSANGLSASASYSASPVPAGPWSLPPEQLGPFGATMPPPAKASFKAQATTLAFDDQVSTPIGNFEETFGRPEHGRARS